MSALILTSEREREINVQHLLGSVFQWNSALSCSALSRERGRERERGGGGGGEGASAAAEMVPEQVRKSDTQFRLLRSNVIGIHGDDKSSVLCAVCCDYQEDRDWTASMT